MSQITLFDDFGNVVDPSPEEASQLSDADQLILADTIEKCRLAQAQDELVTRLRNELYAAVTASTAAIELDQQTNIATTQVENVRAHAAATGHGEKPKPRKIVAKVRQARDAAVEAHTMAQQAYTCRPSWKLKPWPLPRRERRLTRSPIRSRRSIATCCGCGSLSPMGM